MTKPSSVLQLIRQFQERFDIFEAALALQGQAQALPIVVGQHRTADVVGEFREKPIALVVARDDAATQQQRHEGLKIDLMVGEIRGGSANLNSGLSGIFA